jgi:hypothetical protein
MTSCGRILPVVKDNHRPLLVIRLNLVWGAKEDKSGCSIVFFAAIVFHSPGVLVVEYAAAPEAHSKL